MKRLGVFLFLIYSTVSIFSQDGMDMFEGYLFSEDSVPVENAHLINYRTTSVFITDSVGHFCFQVQKGDSLMINHISLLPTIIHANNNDGVDNCYIVPYNIYSLSMCLSEEKDYSADKANFERNINKIYASIEKLGYKRNSKVRVPQRNDLPFSMGGPGASAYLNLLSIKDLIKQGKRNKYLTLE